MIKQNSLIQNKIPLLIKKKKVFNKQIQLEMLDNHKRFLRF